MNKLIAGIDEVGRGSVAGPLAIGLAICIDNKDSRELLKGIKDSKKLSTSKREDWLERINKSSLVNFKISYISPKLIDKYGLSWALKKGVEKVLEGVSLDIVYLDGGLKAPDKYNQKVINKGDEKIPIISAASIFAKVRRDNLMGKESQEYKEYDWDNNKGYGTKKHLEAIKKYGLSKMHRKSFLKNI